MGRRNSRSPQSHRRGLDYNFSTRTMTRTMQRSVPEGMAEDSAAAISETAMTAGRGSPLYQAAEALANETTRSSTINAAKEDLRRLKALVGGPGDLPIDDMNFEDIVKHITEDPDTHLRAIGKCKTNAIERVLLLPGYDTKTGRAPFLPEGAEIAAIERWDWDYASLLAWTRGTSLDRASAYWILHYVLLLWRMENVGATEGSSEIFMNRTRRGNSSKEAIMGDALLGPDIFREVYITVMRNLCAFPGEKLPLRIQEDLIQNNFRMPSCGCKLEDWPYDDSPSNYLREVGNAPPDVSATTEELFEAHSDSRFTSFEQGLPMRGSLGLICCLKSGHANDKGVTLIKGADGGLRIRAPIGDSHYGEQMYSEWDVPALQMGRGIWAAAEMIALMGVSDAIGVMIVPDKLIFLEMMWTAARELDNWSKESQRSFFLSALKNGELSEKKGLQSEINEILLDWDTPNLNKEGRLSQVYEHSLRSLRGLFALSLAADPREDASPLLPFEGAFEELFNISCFGALASGETRTKASRLLSVVDLPKGMFDTPEFGWMAMHHWLIGRFVESTYAAMRVTADELSGGVASPLVTGDPLVAAELWQKAVGLAQKQLDANSTQILHDLDHWGLAPRRVHPTEKDRDYLERVAAAFLSEAARCCLVKPYPNMRNTTQPMLSKFYGASVKESLDRDGRARPRKITYRQYKKAEAHLREELFISASAFEGGLRIQWPGLFLEYNPQGSPVAPQKAKLINFGPAILRRNLLETCLEIDYSSAAIDRVHLAMLYATIHRTLIDSPKELLQSSELKKLRRGLGRQATPGDFFNSVGGKALREFYEGHSAPASMLSDDLGDSYGMLMKASGTFTDMGSWWATSTIVNAARRNADERGGGEEAYREELEKISTEFNRPELLTYTPAELSCLTSYYAVMWDIHERNVFTLDETLLDSFMALKEVADVPAEDFTLPYPVTYVRFKSGRFGAEPDYAYPGVKSCRQMLDGVLLMKDREGVLSATMYLENDPALTQPLPSEDSPLYKTLICTPMTIALPLSSYEDIRALADDIAEAARQRVSSRLDILRGRLAEEENWDEKKWENFRKKDLRDMGRLVHAAFHTAVYLCDPREDFRKIPAKVIQLKGVSKKKRAHLEKEAARQSPSVVYIVGEMFRNEVRMSYESSPNPGERTIRHRHYVKAHYCWQPYGPGRSLRRYQKRKAHYRGSSEKGSKKPNYDLRLQPAKDHD